MSKLRFVVVGGGIAGVSCVNGILSNGNDDYEIYLISSSKFVKTVANWTKVGQFTEFFDVHESSLFSDNPFVTFIEAAVTSWNSTSKILLLSTQQEVRYDYLCISTGSSPRCPFKHERVLTLRDSDSATRLKSSLETSRSVAIVGNGGIATELVYELKNVSVAWIIRDDSFSSVFFPSRVAEFFATNLTHGRLQERYQHFLTQLHEFQNQALPRIGQTPVNWGHFLLDLGKYILNLGIIGTKTSGILKRGRFTTETTSNEMYGCALGPDWSTAIPLSSSLGSKRNVRVIYKAEVVDVHGNNDNVSLKLSNGEEVDCDIVIWAGGVTPNIDVWSTATLEFGADGGILVDDEMRTCIADVFACGDVCSVQWTEESDLWQQMRLWTQARQMGDYAARCMLAASKSQHVERDFCFELFAHSTSFFGYKIVFLGDFKCVKHADNDWYVVERVISDTEYVYCAMVRHRVVGAVLVGETNLEETLENLILNGTDLERIEENFLDPAIDIEDYFD